MPPRTLSSLLSFSTPKGPPSASRPFASVFSFARARPSRLFPSPSRPYHTRLSSPPSLLPHARRDALLVHQCASAPSSPIVIGRTRAIHSTAGKFAPAHLRHWKVILICLLVVARHGSITRPEPGTGCVCTIPPPLLLMVITCTNRPLGPDTESSCTSRTRRASRSRLSR